MLGSEPMTTDRLETVRCAKCNHDQPRRLVRCLYCGSDLGAAAGGAPKRNCPVCKTGMATVTLGWVLVDRCTTCFGEFYDTGELERVKGLSDADARWLRETELPRDAVGAAARLCPACRIKMESVQMGYGVIVETCARCRGVWCDRGEAEKLGVAVRDRKENVGIAADVMQEAEDVAWTLGLVGDLALDSMEGGNRAGRRLARAIRDDKRRTAEMDDLMREQEEQERQSLARRPVRGAPPPPPSGSWGGDPIPADWQPPKKPGTK
jgi:Zn-finger nucleic acid-binding protein